jgi:hypothetical protein
MANELAGTRSFLTFQRRKDANEAFCGRISLSYPHSRLKRGQESGTFAFICTYSSLCLGKRNESEVIQKYTSISLLPLAVFPATIVWNATPTIDTSGMPLVRRAIRRESERERERKSEAQRLKRSYSETRDSEPTEHPQKNNGIVIYDLNHNLPAVLVVPCCRLLRRRQTAEVSLHRSLLEGGLGVECGEATSGRDEAAGVGLARHLGGEGAQAAWAHL